MLSNGRFPSRTMEGYVCTILLSLVDFLPEQAKCSVLSNSAVLFNKSCSSELSLCSEQNISSQPPASFPGQAHCEAALGLSQANPLVPICAAQLFLVQRSTNDMQANKQHHVFSLVTASHTRLTITLRKLTDLNMKTHQSTSCCLFHAEGKPLCGKMFLRVIFHVMYFFVFPAMLQQVLFKRMNL